MTKPFNISSFIKATIVKSIWALTVSISLCSLLSSCRNGGNNPSTETPSQIIPNNNESKIGPTIKIHNLEIMQRDLGIQMTWYEAMDACESLGNGWRLPTNNELRIFYDYNDEINGSRYPRMHGTYWGSEYNSGEAWNEFFNSNTGSDQNLFHNAKSSRFNVRAVKNN